MIKNPNDIVDCLVTDFLDVLRENLISVIMHGCAVSHEFVPGKSIISISVILSDLSVEIVQKCVPVQTYWKKKGVIVSFYFTPELLRKLQYTHPVELLNIKNNYRVLYGDDLFSKMELQKNFIILQCDRELKSVSMSLRSDFINIFRKEKKIKSVLMTLFPRLLPLFCAILITVDRKMCRSESEIISGIEDLCGLGISALSDLFYDNQRFKNQNLNLLIRFVEAIDKIECFVNQIRENQTES
ncbi:MAG: hypothetical protein GXY77_07480 [Fibrobacter sp.]|nr:hypothetical protein [Fibrobacter sp.]